MPHLSCFKAYDIRGKVGPELNEEIAYRIGRAYVEFLDAKRIVVGHDVRLSSESLNKALIQGINDASADVIDIGVAGTEEMYFASFHLDVDGGIEITASHNPIDYNGMKFVKRGAIAISSDTGLNEIRRLAEGNQFQTSGHTGRCVQQSILKDYCDHLLSYIDLAVIKPLRLVFNSGNGVAGHVIDELERRFQALSIPVEFIKLHHEPDGNFPNGIPNPLLLEHRGLTAKSVIAHQANMGIAFDSDFDRCFFFDEKGQFIEGYYIVGLLASIILPHNPSEKIIHDPRLTWNTLDVARSSGGIPIQCKAGHAFIKECMRKENAIYGGEMSSHHYFRDFAYCDSGMIPWILLMELLCKTAKPLSQMLEHRIKLYPCSGELNYQVQEITSVLDRLLNHYLNLDPENKPVVDKTDGISLEFKDWRMNIRPSNTEALLRLNIESRGSKTLVAERLKEVEALIKSAL